MNNSKPHGIYIVSEEGCLRGRSGASQHVSMGVMQLKKYFEISCNFDSVKHGSHMQDAQSIMHQQQKSITVKDNNLLTGSFRDVRVLLKKIPEAIKNLLFIRRCKPDFVYARASFLDPLPVLLKAFSDIPCFIEANGIQVESRKKYYDSFLSKLNRWFEKFTYSIANHVFFVGSYGSYWKLKTSNWSNIENGVERSFIEKFALHKKRVDNKINLIVVARLMAHHQPQILIDAIKQLRLEEKESLCIHLAGSGLEQMYHQLSEHVQVVNHGFLSREKLSQCLENMHAGLIPGAPEYQSQMKLFDYGASKCLAIIPQTHNFQYWFSDDEVEFFEPESSESLANVLTSFIHNPCLMLKKGEKLYARISAEFTWEKIFRLEAKIIKNELDLRENIPSIKKQELPKKIIAK